jgi:hypothetical protein
MPQKENKLITNSQTFLTELERRGVKAITRTAFAEFYRIIDGSKL